MKRIRVVRSKESAPLNPLPRPFTTSGGSATFVHFLTDTTFAEADGPIDFYNNASPVAGGDANTYFQNTPDGLLVKETGLYRISFWGQMEADQTFVYTDGWHVPAELQLVGVKDGVSHYYDAAGQTLIPGGAGWSAPWVVDAGWTLQVHIFNDLHVTNPGFSIEHLGSAPAANRSTIDRLQFGGGYSIYKDFWFTWADIIYPVHGGSSYVSNGWGIMGDQNSPTWDPEYEEDWWWSEVWELGFLQSGTFKITATTEFVPPPGGPWYYGMGMSLISFVPPPVYDYWQENELNWEFIGQDGKGTWETYWNVNKYSFMEFAHGWGEPDGAGGATGSIARGGLNRLTVEKVDDVPLSHPNTWDVVVQPSVTWLHDVTSRYTLPHDATLESISLREDLVLGEPSYAHTHDEWFDTYIDWGYYLQLPSVNVDTGQPLAVPNIANPTMMFDGVNHDQTNTKDVYVKRDLPAGTQVWVEQAGYAHKVWKDPLLSMTLHFSGDAAAPADGSIEWPKHDVETPDFVATGTTSSGLWTAEVIFGPLPTRLRVYGWVLSPVAETTVTCQIVSYPNTVQAQCDSSLPYWEQLPMCVEPDGLITVQCWAADGLAHPVTVTLLCREHTAGSAYPWTYGDTHKTFVW